jgi:hypothetical protein
VPRQWRQVVRAGVYSKSQTGDDYLTLRGQHPNFEAATLPVQNCDFTVCSPKSSISTIAFCSISLLMAVLWGFLQQ